VPHSVRVPKQREAHDSVWRIRPVRATADISAIASVWHRRPVSARPASGITAVAGSAFDQDGQGEPARWRAREYEPTRRAIQSGIIPIQNLRF